MGSNYLYRLEYITSLSEFKPFMFCRKVQILCLDVKPHERVGEQLQPDGGQAAGLPVPGGEGASGDDRITGAFNDDDDDDDLCVR